MNNEDVINILRVIDYWIGLFNTWKVLKSDYVIFASDDKDVIRIISHNLSSFDRLGKIFVVAASWDIDEEIRNNTDVEYNFIVAEYKMIEALNKIPSIYYIFDNIYRSSFDGEDIDGYKLVGVEGITIEDIIKFGVLRLGRMPLESKDRSIYLYKEFENIKRELFEILPIGKRIYKDICSNTSEKIIFISPLPGTGDIFLLSMYLREYINRYNVEEYLLYVTNDHLRKLADLMGIKASVMDGESMKAFYTWRRINDLSYDNIKILDQNIYQKQNNLLQAVPGNNYNLMISRLIFDDIIIDNSKHYLTKKKCDEKKYGLRAGKNILIAPYAQTIDEVDVSFWQRLVDAFLLKQYIVYVNAVTKNEDKINGVKPIFIPYEELDDFCKNCVAVIGVRSGLFDVISDVECKLVVLYTGKLYNSQNDTIQFFGLRKMGLRKKDLLEIQWNDLEQNQEKIRQDILDYVLE